MSQRLTISGFLGIEQAELHVRPITLIIGEQASGKSVIARLLYFFYTYLADFDELSLSKNEHKSTYDKNKKLEFYNIFPQYTWTDDEFEIGFEYNEHQISISSAANSNAVRIKTSKAVADYFRDLKREFQKFQAQSESESLFSTSRALREFRMLQLERDLRLYEQPLFVPAARSFYATIRDEIFRLLSLDSEIDQIILQFGDFYEAAKRSPLFRHTGRGRVDRVGSSRRIEHDYFNRIVKGQLTQIDGRDWLETSRGRIELSKASSGQQEAAPLLMAISRFPQPGRALIIEEPEAHLFPSAQVEILDFMIYQAKAQRANFVFTTHSPYLLSALNGFLVRAEARLDKHLAPESVGAYCLSKGKLVSLLDPESGLIEASYIDEISEQLEEEFVAALDALDEPS